MSLRDLFPAENMRGWYAHLTNQGAHRRRVVCGLHTVKKPDGRAWSDGGLIAAPKPRARQITPELRSQ